MRSRRLLVPAISVLLAIVVGAFDRNAAGQEGTPRLVVLLVVDQFRADYVENLQHQWTAGLRRLIAEGAWFRQVSYPFSGTLTCAGHATVSTGTLPTVHGIVGNAWWDRSRRAIVACADDPTARPISYGTPLTRGGESAAQLLAPTLADELRAQLSPAARTIAFSLKARSAVILAGRQPSAVAWLTEDGTWETSTAYSTGPVAAVSHFISGHPIEHDLGRTWDRTLPKAAYLYEDPAIGAKPAVAATTSFPHVIRTAVQWQSSPYADEYLAQMATSVASELKLGSTGQTDLIAIGFSSLDEVGHEFGPNSHEIQDVLVRLDRTLGQFFADLDRLAGRGNYVVALTADHGVAPMPERARLFGLDAGRVSSRMVIEATERAVARVLGSGTHVDQVIGTDIYLAPKIYDRLRAASSGLNAVKDALTAIPGIAAAYTREELENGLAGSDEGIRRQMSNSHFAARSGDIRFALRPYWLLVPTGTSHGTGYEYDARVPLFLMGHGIVHGQYLKPASPMDVAPTLAFLAGATLPRTEGRVLSEALTRNK